MCGQPTKKTSLRSNRIMTKLLAPSNRNKKNSKKQLLVGDNNSCRRYRTTTKRVGCKFKFLV